MQFWTSFYLSDCIKINLEGPKIPDFEFGEEAVQSIVFRGVWGHATQEKILPGWQLESSLFILNFVLQG